MPSLATVSGAIHLRRTPHLTPALCASFALEQTVSKKVGIPMDRVLVNLDEYANTSAGTIPLCLDEAVRSGKVKPGDVIAMAGFGAGLSWGSAVIRWG
jgi:3-oxoacyl-[acyl-carrier-protein] synthase-3